MTWFATTFDTSSCYSLSSAQNMLFLDMAQECISSTGSRTLMSEVGQSDCNPSAQTGEMGISRAHWWLDQLDCPPLGSVRDPDSINTWSVPEKDILCQLLPFSTCVHITSYTRAHTLPCLCTPHTHMQKQKKLNIHSHETHLFYVPRDLLWI